MCFTYPAGIKGAIKLLAYGGALPDIPAQCLLTIVAVGLFTADKRPMLKETTWLDTWMSYCPPTYHRAQQSPSNKLINHIHVCGY